MSKKRIIEYLSKRRIMGLPIDGVVVANASSDEVTRLLEKRLGPLGRYIHRDENNLKVDISDENMIYNANIYIDGGLKVWFGDLYMDEDTQKTLKEVCTLTSRTLYVLHEMDGRFLSFVPNNEYLEKVARYKITQDSFEKREPHLTIMAFVDGKQEIITIPKNRRRKIVNGTDNVLKEFGKLFRKKFKRK